MTEHYLGIVPELADLEPYMDRLESSGRWEKLKREVVKGCGANKNRAAALLLRQSCYMFMFSMLSLTQCVDPCAQCTAAVA